MSTEISQEAARELLEASKDIAWDYEALAFPESDPVVNARRRARLNALRTAIARAKEGGEG